MLGNHRPFRKVGSLKFPKPTPWAPDRSLRFELLPELSHADLP